MKVAGFVSKERLRSSEIKEDGLCFVERRSSTISKSLVLRAKNGYIAQKLKFKMAYVLLSDDHQPYQSRWFCKQRMAT